MNDQGQRCASFRQLHESGCFVIPNPFDRGTAISLQRLGFHAIATSSAGFAFTRGLPDRADVLDADSVLAHVADIVSAVDIPVNADFQAGYADTSDGVYQNVIRCVETGVAGLSIEDATGNDDQPLFNLDDAVDRVRAARSAIDACDHDVLLTARAECFLVHHDDALRESVRRLQAYAEAGADVLFAPGVRERDDIRAIVEAVHPKPINVLMSGPSDVTLSDLRAMGVRRVSVGSALARAAWGGFLNAARAVAQDESFGVLASAAPFDELNAMFE